jgi:hypothetical protein
MSSRHSRDPSRKNERDHCQYPKEEWQSTKKWRRNTSKRERWKRKKKRNRMNGKKDVKDGKREREKRNRKNGNK